MLKRKKLLRENLVEDKLSHFTRKRTETDKEQTDQCILSFYFLNVRTTGSAPFDFNLPRFIA